MNEMAKEKEIPFNIVIYPLLYKNLWGRYPFKPIHTLLIDFCKNNSLKCVDGYLAFDSYRSLKKFTVHPVDYHPNRLANELMVQLFSSQK